MSQPRLPEPTEAIAATASRDPIEALCATLSGGARLVTLVGIGGVGKSRVALAALRRLEARGVATSVSDVAAVHGPTGLAIAIAQALGVSSTAAPQRMAPLDALAQLPREPRVLLLDNFERLVGARELGEVAGRALVSCLAHAPALRILVTSRVALALPEEVVVVLPPSASAGHDAPDVDWSWGQLTPAERRGLCRLSVIDGAFDFALAQRMIGAGATGGVPPLEILEALVRVSLVGIEPSAEGTRYRLLESVRARARESSSPAEQEQALDDLGEALFARLPPADELAYFARREPELQLDERLRLLSVVRRAQTDGRREALTQGLRAAAELTLAFARSGFGAEVMAHLFALLDRPDVEAVALEVRLMAGTCAVAIGSADLDLAARVDRLIERLSAWTAGSDNPRQPLVVQCMLALVLNRRWDFPRLHPLSRALVAAPIIAADLRLYRGPVERLVFSKRALGLSDFAVDDALLADLEARLHAAGEVFNALHVHANRACLALNLGRPEHALALMDEVEPAAVEAGFVRLAALVHRERARAEREAGRRAVALAAFDEALRALAGTSEHTEGLLDRAATALEAGRHDEARRDLDTASASLALAASAATPFELGYRRALEQAYAALAGGSDAVVDAVGIGGHVATGTVEDAAFEALGALARDDRADPERDAVVRSRAEAAAPFSFRACQALRLFDVARGLASDAPDVMAVAGAAFRVAGRWVDLAARPLLGVLLDVLARAHLDGAPRVDKAALAAAAWPGERMRVESRDRRLESAMSKLRKEGLPVIGAHGGYAIDPAVRVVRVARARWPGRGATNVGRGRGRPRRVS